MSSTLSTPDPAQQVAEVREIIVHRGDHSCEATLLAIRRVVMPPPADDEPTWFDSGVGSGLRDGVGAARRPGAVLTGCSKIWSSLEKAGSSDEGLPSDSEEAPTPRIRDGRDSRTDWSPTVTNDNKPGVEW